MSVLGVVDESLVANMWAYLWRVCSGRYFADASVWFSIVSALAVYDFNKAKDIEGQEIEVTERFTSDAVMCVVSAFAQQKHLSYSSGTVNPSHFNAKSCLVPKQRDSW